MAKRDAHVLFELIDCETAQVRLLQITSTAQAKIEAERTFNKTGHKQVLRRVTKTIVHVVEG